jgi:hypothetical protein
MFTSRNINTSFRFSFVSWGSFAAIRVVSDRVSIFLPKGLKIGLYSHQSLIFFGLLPKFWPNGCWIVKRRCVWRLWYSLEHRQWNRFRILIWWSHICLFWKEKGCVSCECHQFIKNWTILLFSAISIVYCKAWTLYHLFLSSGSPTKVQIKSQKVHIRRKLALNIKIVKRSL